MKDIAEKRELNVKTLLMAVAMTAFAMSHAHAAEPQAHAAVLAKPESAVSADTVTVGDVFDGAGDYADRYLAPAPAPGDSMTLTAYDLARISRAFNLGWQPAAGSADRVVIRRESSEIDRYAIESELQKEIAEKMEGRKFEMALNDKNLSLQLPARSEKSLRVEDLSLDERHGTFTATLAAPAENPVLRKTVSGRLYALVETPVLKSSFRAGDIIGASDVQYVDMRATDMPAGLVTDAEKIIGLTPRRGISAMQPVMASDLEAPMAVRKGEIVTVVLKAGLMNLTMQGRALQNGAEGDVVRLINTASNRALEGTVTGPQTITISPPAAEM